MGDRGAVVSGLRRTATYVSIDAGRVAVRFVGDAVDAPPTLFEDSDNAADAIGRRLAGGSVYRLLYSSSVDFPDEYGMPDFHAAEFEEAVASAIRRHSGPPAWDGKDAIR